MEIKSTNKPEAWFGTGGGLYGKDEKPYIKQPYASTGYGLATVGMILKAGLLRDNVNHLVGNDPRRYEITQAEMDRIVASKQKYDEQIAMSLAGLKTRDGRTINYRTTLGTDYDKRHYAGDILQIAECVLSRYDGVPNFARKKTNLLGQAVWEVMAIVDGGDTKIGWENPNQAEYNRTAPMHEIIEYEKWNETPYHRVLMEVLHEINPNIKVDYHTVSGEPDMGDELQKAPYSSLPPHNYYDKHGNVKTHKGHTTPLMDDDYDTYVENHSYIPNRKSKDSIRYYNDIVTGYESLYHDLENDRIYQIQRLLASQPSAENARKLIRLLTAEKMTEMQRILTPRESLDIKNRKEIIL